MPSQELPVTAQLPIHIHTTRTPSSSAYSSNWRRFNQEVTTSVCITSEGADLASWTQSQHSYDRWIVIHNKLYFYGKPSLSLLDTKAVGKTSHGLHFQQQPRSPSTSRQMNPLRKKVLVTLPLLHSSFGGADVRMSSDKPYLMLAEMGFRGDRAAPDNLVPLLTSALSFRFPTRVLSISTGGHLGKCTSTLSSPVPPANKGETSSVGPDNDLMSMNPPSPSPSFPTIPIIKHHNSLKSSRKRFSSDEDVNPNFGPTEVVGMNSNLFEMDLSTTNTQPPPTPHQLPNIPIQIGYLRRGMFKRLNRIVSLVPLFRPAQNDTTPIIDELSNEERNQQLMEYPAVPKALCYAVKLIGTLVTPPLLPLPIFATESQSIVIKKAAAAVVLKAQLILDSSTASQFNSAPQWKSTSCNPETYERISRSTRCDGCTPVDVT
ncbi:hypothetical protein BLNAU_3541 [Blattamonas nauphoetae]|uniref:Uncharacterized protein n=1 Tax=Blattamonas nauphoetae TaxID=2049346 RepID=A0ABQ9YCD7_9EUKA|nr:hypothetical protein BLNAU_3541 [Blattamonas nauphoetae]